MNLNLSALSGSQLTCVLLSAIVMLGLVLIVWGENVAERREVRSRRARRVEEKSRTIEVTPPAQDTAPSVVDTAPLNVYRLPTKDVPHTTTSQDDDKK